MLRVTIELVPHGVEERKRTIASMEIGNDGSGSPFLGSYIFRRYGSTGQKMETGSIGEFHRQDYNAWRLLQGILGVLYPDQSPAWRDGAPRGKLHGRT